jgi:hypothetical protein
MNTYLSQFIDAHPDATAAELVQLAAQQPPVTAAVIPLASLAPLLRKTGLSNVLKAVAADANANPVLRAGVGAFLDQLADLRQANLDTTDAEIATQAAAVLAALAPAAQANGIDAAAATAAIYALGGGLRYPAVTEQEVTDYRAVKARDDAWHALNNARFTADLARSEKLNWLRDHAAAELPADLAGLDAFEVPAE